MARRQRISSVADRLKDKLVAPTPVTADLVRPYQSALYYYVAAWRVDKLPPFNIWVADIMRYDPQIDFGLRIRNGPLMAADAVIDAPDEEVGQWVQKQWNRIWSTSAYKVLLTRMYGYMGYEVMYRREPNGFVGFKKLKDLHPSMVRPLTHGNEVKGIRVRPHGSFGFAYTEIGKTPKATEDPYALLSPKCLWTTYEGKFENPFGEPILERAYSSWWEKWMESGAKRSAMLRMVKDAWVGDIIYYPHNKKFINANNEEVTGRDLAREIAENRMSGGAICLPSIWEDGKQMFQYIPPAGIAGDTKIFEWQEILNLEIWKGLGVPKEVLEAAGTGSGFSGRSIPFLAFVSGLMTEFQELIRCIDEHILRPLAWLNFGTEPDYEIKPMEIDQLLQKLTGGSNPAAMAGGGVGMGLPPQVMAALAQQGGQQRQFSDDSPGDTALTAAKEKLPTVDRIVADTGVSPRAAELARLAVAASQNTATCTAERLLKTAGVTTAVAPITRTLDRVGQHILANGVPNMAYHFADEDLLECADEEFEDDDPEQDEDDETEYEEGEEALLDDEGDDDFDNDDDEAEYEDTEAALEEDDGDDDTESDDEWDMDCDEEDELDDIYEDEEDDEDEGFEIREDASRQFSDDATHYHQVYKRLIDSLPDPSVTIQHIRNTFTTIPKHHLKAIAEMEGVPGMGQHLAAWAEAEKISHIRNSKI